MKHDREYDEHHRTLSHILVRYNDTRNMRHHHHPYRSLGIAKNAIRVVGRVGARSSDEVLDSRLWIHESDRDFILAALFRSKERYACVW